MIKKGDFNIEWVDRGIEPQNPPDPKYPQGIDINNSMPGRPACKTPLPYPAQRCGYWFVKCERCGCSVLITTAGRVDDPRSLTISCKTS